MMRLQGLDAESRLVGRLLATAESGAGSILLVEGCAGGGKSALLMSAAVAALDRGFAVASSVDRPTLSFAGRSLAAPRSTFRVLPALGDEAGIPQLRGWLAAQHEPRSGKSDGRGEPLLVTLDDLHELPASRAKALATLPMQYAQSPVVWLLSRRIGLGGSKVQRLFSFDGTDVTRIRLEAMGRNDTAALVTDVAKAEPSPELLALAQLAGGNRLLVVELVRGLIEEHGDAVVRDSAKLSELRLPQRLRNAVDLLLSSVSSRCRNMLQMVALSGGHLSLPRIAALLEEPAGALVPLIGEAVDMGVLAADASGLVFAQELTRRALVEEIPSVVAHQLTEEFACAGRPAVGYAPRGSDGSEQERHGGEVAVVPFPRTERQETAKGSVPDPRSPQAERDRYHLTETQRTIAQLVGAGLTNQQIASRLHLSPHTVNYHLRKIFRRLAIHSRVELATLIQQA